MENLGVSEIDCWGAAGTFEGVIAGIVRETEEH
jgi:hypothetical protein